MTSTTVIVRAYRALFGALAVFAVVTTYTLSTGNPGFSAGNFFSYFTIQSNVLVAGLLLYLAARPDTDGRWDGVRGAFTLYIVITGIIYNALLRGVNVEVPNEFCNEVLHVIVPLVGLVDWVLVAPRRPVTLVTSLQFLLFPVAYFGYSLLRGAATGWYPYPFLDPTKDGGYPRIVIYAIVLTILMTLLALAVAELGRMAFRRVNPQPDDPILDGVALERPAPEPPAPGRSGHHDPA